jgi:type I restriction enzyme S subunit
MLGIGAATNQACAAIFPDNQVNSEYLYFFFEYCYHDIRNFAHGANQKNLSADLIKSFPVSYPKDMEEQQEMVNILKKLDTKIRIHNRKKNFYKDLFRTLLHELMTAQIRVNNIELNKYEISV